MLNVCVIVQIYVQRKATQSARRASPKAAEASGDEGMDVDLDNFMTLDSVGDVDGEKICVLLLIFIIFIWFMT